MFNVEKVKYKVEFYIANSDKDLKEAEVIKFYNEQGYSVYTEYRSLLSELKLKANTMALFKKYKSGYPDLLLKRNGEVKFIEIKVNRDSLRPNQVLFNSLLAEFEDVTIAYFYDRGHLDYFEHVKSNGRNKMKFEDLKKEIKNQTIYYYKIAKDKNLKKLWVVVQLHKKYGKAILKKEIIGEIASAIQEKKDKIVWFIKEHLSK